MFAELTGPQRPENMTISLTHFMASSIASSLTKQLTPNRLRSHEIWRTPKGDTAELLLYCLPKPTPKMRYLQTPGYPVMVVVISNKAAQSENEEPSQPNSVTSQRQSRCRPKKADTGRELARRQEGQHRSFPMTSSFCDSYSSRSVMLLTPNSMLGQLDFKGLIWEQPGPSVLVEGHLRKKRRKARQREEVDVREGKLVK